MFSLEVFPPKRTSPVGTIYDTLDGLQGLDPDFISVTYGTASTVPNRQEYSNMPAICPCISASSVRA